jgi:D-3-phosphoglycerate dehydrogenase
MDTFRIKIMDNIAPEGLALFTQRYHVDREENDPLGIVVRSSRVDLERFPQLIAVARAGAGVNNIPVDRASEKGICVFNTPGANANAVVELVYTMLGTWLRHIHEGILFSQSLAGLRGTDRAAEQGDRRTRFNGFPGRHEARGPAAQFCPGAHR